jgi:GNAT superfamily N-acetyltransferase
VKPVDTRRPSALNLAYLFHAFKADIEPTVMRIQPSSETLLLFDREVQCYLRWVRVLDRMGRARPGGISCWYHGRVLSIYTRAGTPGSRLRGRNSLCLADIQVKPGYQGQGFLGMLVKALVAERDLPFDRLEIESLLNAELGRWLEQNGFSRFHSVPGFGELGACFARALLSGLATPDEG